MRLVNVRMLLYMLAMRAYGLLDIQQRFWVSAFPYVDMITILYHILLHAFFCGYHCVCNRSSSCY
jgi:hypothetical protein